MYCMKCGAKNEDDKRFCTSCGAPLDETIALEPPVQSSGSPVVGYDAPEVRGDVKRRGGGRKRPPTSIIVALILALLSVALVLVFVFLHPLDILFPQKESKRVEPPAQVVRQDDEAREDVEDEDEPGDEPEDEERDTGPAARASLGEYSWEELSDIANEIAACKSWNEAADLAESYNLCGAGGKVFSASKDVKTSDGKTISFQLVDVYHDEAQDGGKAGLTFLATGISHHHRMAGGTTMAGGWEGSDMRSWLRTDVLPTLPDDLVSVIRPVYKQYNNEGKTSSSSAVTKTADELWLPSIAELVGRVSWEYSSDPSRSDYFNSVFNAEGFQYAAFQQIGMATEGPNRSLAHGENWWMRSSAASTGRGRYVTSDGSPDGFGDSNQSFGVLFGFCL